MITKSGLMVGLGESFEEMVEASGSCASTGSRFSPSASTCARPRIICPSCATRIQEEDFGALEKAANRLGLPSRSLAGHWSAPATTPIRTCRRRHSLETELGLGCKRSRPGRQ